MNIMRAKKFKHKTNEKKNSRIERENQIKKISNASNMEVQFSDDVQEKEIDDSIADTDSTDSEVSTLASFERQKR